MRSKMRAAAGYRLRQGWREFLLCSVVFFAGRARARMNERNAAQRNAVKEWLALAWVKNAWWCDCKECSLRNDCKEHDHSR